MGFAVPRKNKFRKLKLGKRFLFIWRGLLNEHDYSNIVSNSDDWLRWHKLIYRCIVNNCTSRGHPRPPQRSVPYCWPHHIARGSQSTHHTANSSRRKIVWQVDSRVWRCCDELIVLNVRRVHELASPISDAAPPLITPSILSTVSRCYLTGVQIKNVTSMVALLYARLWRVDCVTRCVCDKLTGDELTVWRVDRVTRWPCDELTGSLARHCLTRGTIHIDAAPASTVLQRSHQQTIFCEGVFRYSFSNSGLRSQFT